MTPETHRVLAHPIRRRVLAVMQDLDRQLSVTMFIREVGGENVAGTAYHFKVLQAAGLIRLVREVPVRGSVEKFYVPGEQLTAELRDTLALDRIAEVLGEGRPAAWVIDRVIKVLRAAGRDPGASV